MAVYPDGNPGVYPLDASTPTGQFRMVIGDTNSTAYNPIQSGYQNYEAFSDAEIQSLLSLSGDDLATSIGYAYLKLASVAASEAIDWSSDDLRVTMSKKPAEIRAIAEMWFGRSGNSGAGADIFDIVHTGEDYCADEFYPFWVVPEDRIRLF